VVQVLRLKPGRRFCTLGRLAHEVGWGHRDLVVRLEAKRKVRHAHDTVPHHTTPHQATLWGHAHAHASLSVLGLVSWMACHVHQGPRYMTVDGLNFLLVGAVELITSFLCRVAAPSRLSRRRSTRRRRLPRRPRPWLSARPPPSSPP
jgi:hypothetical protein